MGKLNLKFKSLKFSLLIKNFRDFSVVVGSSPEGLANTR